MELARTTQEPYRPPWFKNVLRTLKVEAASSHFWTTTPKRNTTTKVVVFLFALCWQKRCVPENALLFSLLSQVFHSWRFNINRRITAKKKRLSAYTVNPIDERHWIIIWNILFVASAGSKRVILLSHWRKAHPAVGADRAGHLKQVKAEENTVTPPCFSLLWALIRRTAPERRKPNIFLLIFWECIIIWNSTPCIQCVIHGTAFRSSADIVARIVILSRITNQF